MGKQKLNEDVAYFEPLDYDVSHIYKRSLDQNDHKLHIQFNSHDRNFHLILQRDSSTFHESVAVERHNEIGNCNYKYTFV